MSMDGSFPVAVAHQTNSTQHDCNFRFDAGDKAGVGPHTRGLHDVGISLFGRLAATPSPKPFPSQPHLTHHQLAPLTAYKGELECCTRETSTWALK